MTDKMYDLSRALDSLLDYEDSERFREMSVAQLDLEYEEWGRATEEYLKQGDWDTAGCLVLNMQAVLAYRLKCLLNFSDSERTLYYNREGEDFRTGFERRQKDLPRPEMDETWGYDYLVRWFPGLVG